MDPFITKLNEYGLSILDPATPDLPITKTPDLIGDFSLEDNFWNIFNSSFSISITDLTLFQQKLSLSIIDNNWYNLFVPFAGIHMVEPNDEMQFTTRLYYSKFVDILKDSSLHTSIPWDSLIKKFELKHLFEPGNIEMSLFNDFLRYIMLLNNHQHNQIQFNELYNVLYDSYMNTFKHL